MPPPRLGDRDVGTTVSLRVRTPAGPTDVVGVVVTVEDAAVTVRRRDGTLTRVDAGAVEAGRRVPPSPSQRIDVAALQRIAAEGWRAPEVASLGEWLLRAGGGFTGRANSALVVGDPGCAPDAAIDQVARWYAARGLPAKVQVPAGQSPGLLELLIERAWTVSPPTHVMTAELSHVLRATSTAAGEVRLDPEPDDAWLAAYRQDGGALPAAARDILTNHPLVVFASVREQAAARPVAIARVTVDGRWAGLFAVEVAPAHRRRGLGTAVTAAALRWAGARGARHVYLQAAADNAAAIAVYERLGFVVHHDYVYAQHPSAQPPPPPPPPPPQRS